MPSLYETDVECQEVEKLCQMTPKEASKKIGNQLLRNVKPHQILTRDGSTKGCKFDTSWDHIQASIIKNNGVVGSSLILALAHTGLELPLQLLLEKGANIEARTDFYSQTSLMLAAQGGHYAVVRLLLKEGAAINARDARQWTALIVAAESGREAVVRLLVEKGADLKQRCHNGQTAKEHASSFPTIQRFLTAAEEPRNDYHV